MEFSPIACLFCFGYYASMNPNLDEKLCVYLLFAIEIIILNDLILKSSIILYNLDQLTELKWNRLALYFHMWLHVVR